MSIVAVDETNLTLAFNLCWLGAAIIVALMTGILRPRRGPVDRLIERDENGLLSPERAVDWANVLTLALGAMACFATWVLVQIVYASIRQPKIDGAGEPRWAPGDLVLLQLIAPTVAWIAGYMLLRGRHLLGVVGYEVRRMMNGLLAGTLGIFIALPIVYFALQGTLWFWQTIHIDHPAKHPLLIAMDETPSEWVHIGAIIAAVLTAPLFEELLFRGFIQTAARRATRSPIIAVLISSVLFAAIHPRWTIPPIFVFAVLLGLVYERTRNLWATTVMHALFNASALFLPGP